MSDSSEPVEPPQDSIETSPAADPTGQDEPEVPGSEAPHESPPEEHAEAAEPKADRHEGKKGEGAKKWRREPGLALSFRKGLPVDGKVEQVIRGGYEVRVGKARGFCPHSQMDVHHVEEPEAHVGKTYSFRVIQLRRGGEEVVLSRRALLEESRVEEAKSVRATLIEGHVTQGHVVRLTDFGAFIDLGAGVTGLVHVSEIGHARIVRPSDALQPGDTVQVKVLSLGDSGRISLSIRQAMADPWHGVAERFQAGGVTTGTVKRLADFGAFVEIEPGIEALAPSDSFPPGPSGWKDGIEAGQTRSWRIVSVDPQRHRLSVQPSDGAPEPAALEPGSKMKGRVQKVETFGVFVWLRPGTVGLLPNVYTGTKKGTDLTRTFPAGKEVEVEVLEVSPDGRRVRLAVPGAAVAPPPPPQRTSQERPAKPVEPSAPPQSFGTNLGDALRAAFERKSSTGSQS